MHDPDQLPKRGDRFDRYEVLTRLAFGGMAAVYAVRRASIGGFDKLLAMKVMLPHLCDSRDAVSMFLDEGRIAAQIEHPNVLQVFDAAEQERVPFIIMEYVRGQSLANVAKRADEGEAMPLGFLVSVLHKVAQGLHAAHVACDVAGEPLRVVHRDVSPHNVMISYAGDVKVVDFGIAAARGRIASTRSGEIKGKLGYVCPEGIDKSRPLDHRADIWSLGVTAWELLSGKRLFRDDDDATTLWAILNHEVGDLAEVRDDLPASLRRCVMRCLERDVERRPKDCQEVASMLAEVLNDLDGHARKDVSEYVRSLFVEEEAEERELLARLMSTDPEEEASRTAALLEGTDPTAEGLSALARSGVETTGATDVTAQSDITRHAPPKSRAPWAIAVAAVAAAGVVGVMALGGEGATPGTGPAANTASTPTGEAAPEVTAASVAPPAGAGALSSAESAAASARVASPAEPEADAMRPVAPNLAAPKPGASKTAAPKPGASKTAAPKPGAPKPGTPQPGALRPTSPKPAPSNFDNPY